MRVTTRQDDEVAGDLRDGQGDRDGPVKTAVGLTLVHQLEVEDDAAGEGRQEHDVAERVRHDAPKEAVSGDEAELDADIHEDRVLAGLRVGEDLRLQVPLDALVMGDELHQEPGDEAEPQELGDPVVGRGGLREPAGEPDNVHEVVRKVPHVGLPGHAAAFVLKALPQALVVVPVETDHRDQPADVHGIVRFVQTSEVDVQVVEITHNLFPFSFGRCAPVLFEVYAYTFLRFSCTASRAICQQKKKNQH